ncbi:MAG: very short patch repair endonuclease, partial [Gammaproteobacteria bacterium]
LAYEPKTRREFWNAKFQRNVERDREVRQMLLDAGWRVMVVWECGLRNNAARDQGLEFVADWIRSGWTTGEYPSPTLQSSSGC